LLEVGTERRYRLTVDKVPTRTPRNQKVKIPAGLNRTQTDVSPEPSFHRIRFVELRVWRDKTTKIDHADHRLARSCLLGPQIKDPISTLAFCGRLASDALMIFLLISISMHTFFEFLDGSPRKAAEG